MNQQANPWSTQPPAPQSGASSQAPPNPQGPAAKPTAGQASPARTPGGAALYSEAVDVVAVWAAYRDGLNDLGRAEATAHQKRGAAERAQAQALQQAEHDLAAATADREALESELGLFESGVHRVLETTGVSPDGAGTGTITVHMDDVADARAVMVEITSELHRATKDLTAARAAQAARRRRLLATAVVVVAVVASVASLNLLGTNTFATGAGGVLVFAITMLGRRRGPLAAIFSAAAALAAAVLAVTLTGPVLATIVLILAAVIAVVILPRRHRRQSFPAGSRTSNPGGPRV